MNMTYFKKAGRSLACLCATALLVVLPACEMPDMKTGNKVAYHFDEPARIWEETLPLGNGRLGMIPTEV